MEMELCEPNLIESLLLDPVEPRVKSKERVEHRRRGGPRVRCQCGGCGQCKENERWERIFQEKFADPDYYAPRIRLYGSSLA